MQRRVIWLSVGVVVVAAVVFGLKTGVSGADPIRIGVIYNTSGGMKWLDQPSLEGLLLAAEQVNADGGVLGREIEVVSADGTTDVVEMTRLATDLSDRDDIVAIAGISEPLHAVAPVRATIKRATGGFLTFTHSEVAVAVGEVTHDAGVPFVTSGSTRPGLPELVGEDVFMIAATHEAGAAAIAQFAWDDLGARLAWVLVDEESSYAETMASAFEESWQERGGEVTGDTYAPGAVIQIPDQIEGLLDLASEPEVIFIASLQNDGGYLIDQLREAGVDQPILFADVVDPRYIEAMGGDMANVFMATHGALIDPDEDVSAFVAAFTAKYQHAPESPSAMLGYDTLGLIADSIERAGSVDRDQLSQSLAKTTDFAGVTGSLTFGEGHVPVKPITIVEYVEGEPAVVAEIQTG